MSVADSLFKHQQYFAAVVNYEKAFFFAENQNDITASLLKKAYAYKAIGNFAKTTVTLRRIPLQNLPDSTHFAVRYELSLMAFLQQKYPEAESELLQLEQFIQDSTLLTSALFLKILTLNELQKWQEAKVLFESYIAQNEADIDVEKYYGFIEKIKIRDPEKAATWSTFIPGSGQIYGGAPIRGITSFILQAGFLAFAGYQFYHGFYATGFGSGLALFQAFYFGGVTDAEVVTKRKNRQRIRKHNDKIQNLLIQIELNQ